MQPFDVTVVLANDEMYNHLVYSYNDTEAKRAISLFYRDSTILGIIFGASDKENK
jgi:hypothetical protein